MTTNRSMYINCDMGEWDAGHVTNCDRDLMPYIDLCNVACGGHAGSADIMKETISIATGHDSVVGAHPGYADRSSFGRKYVPMIKSELVDLLRRQVDSFLETCDRVDVVPYHIKPHGALYHACHYLTKERDVLIDLVLQRYSYLVLIAAAGSDLANLAKRSGLSVLSEAFIDRKYMPDLTLVARTESSALITDPAEAKEQYDSLCQGKVMTSEGIRSIDADTLCIHGDNVAALRILQEIHG